MGFFDWLNDLMESLHDALDDLQEHMSQIETTNMLAQEENQRFMDEMNQINLLNQTQEMMDMPNDVPDQMDFGDPGFGPGGM